MKSVEIELSEKDKEIQSMKQKYDEMSVTLQNIKCYWKCRTAY